MRKAYILGIMAVFMSASAQAETVTLVADSWCPYNCDKASEKPGFIIEIAQKAFARQNITVEYSQIPWTRAIEETRKGKHTAIVGASRNDAPDFIYPSISQGFMQNAFYVKKDNPWRFKDISSLGAISLGAITDYSYSDEIDRYIKENAKNTKLIQATSGDDALQTNVRKLLANRIGALLEDRYVMQYHLLEKKLQDKVDEAGLAPTSKQNDLFIAFSPSNPKSRKYAEMVAEETKALRASGELKEIMAKYGVTDWQK